MKYLYILLGFICLVLGTIGILFPVLPTTPFYLLTIFLFSKSSSRLELWFKNSKLYNKKIKDFYETRSMKLKTKIILLTFTTSIILTIVFLHKNVIVTIFMFCILLLKYCYFNLYIKTR